MNAVMPLRSTRARPARAARAAPAPRPNLRAQQKAATRAAILDAALAIFSERGFDGASTRDIAARAGVHHALIKYHYRSKDALWRAAVSFLFERQAQELQYTAQPRGGAEERREQARAALRRYVQYCARHPEHGRLMVQESVHDNPRLRWAADQFIRVTSRASGEFIRALQRAGVLPKVSVPALVYIMVGAAQTFYTLAPEVRRVWGIDPADPKTIEAHVEALLAVFIP